MADEIQTGESVPPTVPQEAPVVEPVAEPAKEVPKAKAKTKDGLAENQTKLLSGNVYTAF